MTQVVIVGSGPAGATLALLLVQRGISVKLIEASRTFHRTFRGEGLMPSGLDALDQMGLLPLLEHIPHRRLDAWEFLINNRFLFRVAEPLEPDGQPCTLVSQSALLQSVIDKAIAHPEFEFIQHTSVQDLVWSDQRIAGVTLSDGRSISADLVVGTDGRNSIARQRADLPLVRQPHAFNILWFRLADSPQFQSQNVFYSIVHGSQAFGLFRSSEGNLQIGWALRDSSTDWKQINWSTALASASPPWLAEHLQTHAETIEPPVLLSVVVGRCPRWFAPGLLLLGDAAHPMSPIRAQGINMALRDAIVAANHLVPLLQGDADHHAIDTALARVQAEREPEIIRSQHLQAEEAVQAERLGKSAALRWAVSQMAPLVRIPIRWSWVMRQQQLRQGVSQVRLTV